MNSDTELANMAQGGDSAALGALLERHRGALFAIALGYLRVSCDAEDAVQDAFLLATMHIGSLRNPEAAGAWLRSMVRHVCLNSLRSRRDTQSLAENESWGPVDPAPSLEDRIDSIAARDWVWSAMAELSEATQSVMLLRCFGSFPSYDEIATILDIPVGTVRSRINNGRAQLARALAATTTTEFDPVSRERALIAQQFTEFCERYNAGVVEAGLFERYRPDALAVYQHERSQGVGLLLERLNADVGSGVRMHPTQVLLSSRVLVLEARLENPDDDPHHCPPAMAHVAFIEKGWVHSHHLFHAPRPNH